MPTDHTRGAEGASPTSHTHPPPRGAGRARSAAESERVAGPASDPAAPTGLAGGRHHRGAPSTRPGPARTRARAPAWCLSAAPRTVQRPASTALHGTARQGLARPGRVRHWQGNELNGAARRSVVRRGAARHGTARYVISHNDFITGTRGSGLCQSRATISAVRPHVLPRRRHSGNGTRESRPILSSIRDWGRGGPVSRSGTQCPSRLKSASIGLQRYRNLGRGPLDLRLVHLRVACVQGLPFMTILGVDTLSLLNTCTLLVERGAGTEAALIKALEGRHPPANLAGRAPRSESSQRRANPGIASGRL